MTGESRLHLCVGVAAVIAFVLTGQYMHWVHDHLRGMSEAQRLYIRSAHIYLMWAALLNLVAAGGTATAPQGWLRGLLASTSLAIAAVPVLLLVSFFIETYNPQLVRPLARLAIYLAFGGVLVRALLLQWPRGTRPKRQEAGR